MRSRRAGLKYAIARFPRIPWKKPLIRTIRIAQVNATRTTAFTSGWARSSQRRRNGQKAKTQATQMSVTSSHRQYM